MQKEGAGDYCSGRKEARELKSNTEAELKLYASQAIEALKTEIINLVTDKLAKSNVKAAFEDKEFMQKVILELVKNWARDENSLLVLKMLRN